METGDKFVHRLWTKTREVIHRFAQLVDKPVDKFAGVRQFCETRKAAHQSCGKPVDSVDNFVHMSTGVRRASFPQAVDGAVEKFLPSAGARAGRGHAIPAHRVPCQRPHPRNAKRVQRVLKGCVSLSACTPCLRVFHRVIHMVWMSRSGREASPTGKGRGLATPTPSAHQPCAAM